MLLELAHEYLHREGAPPIGSAKADGAAFLAWLQVQAAASAHFNYLFRVHVLYAGAIRLMHGGIRENDGLAVRAARAAFAQAFAAVGKSVYSEQLAFHMVLYKRAPPEYKRFIDETVGCSEAGVAAGQAQPYDALMEQDIRRLNRLVSKTSGYTHYLFASLHLAALTALRRVARTVFSLSDYFRTPRSQVDTSAALLSWRAEIRRTGFIRQQLTAAASRPLASVGGVPLAAGAAGVFDAGEAAFRGLYAAAKRGESDGWQPPRRVEVDAARAKLQAEKDAEREKEKAALAARPSAENAEELLAMRAQCARLLAANAALQARIAGDAVEEEEEEERSSSDEEY